MMNSPKSLKVIFMCFFGRWFDTKAKFGMDGLAVNTGYCDVGELFLSNRPLSHGRQLRIPYFLLGLSLYLAYIEHQSYDSELTLKILLDEKDHILPYIILERLSSVIVSLSTTVFKSPAIRFI